MAVGEIGGRCKSYYFVLTLVRENQIFVREKSGNFKVDLLCEPCIEVFIKERSVKRVRAGSKSVFNMYVMVSTNTI